MKRIVLEISSLISLISHESKWMDVDIFLQWLQFEEHINSIKEGSIIKTQLLNFGCWISKHYKELSCKSFTSHRERGHNKYDYEMDILINHYILSTFFPFFTLSCQCFVIPILQIWRFVHGKTGGFYVKRENIM